MATRRLGPSWTRRQAASQQRSFGSDPRTTDRQVNDDNFSRIDGKGLGTLGKSFVSTNDNVSSRCPFQGGAEENRYGLVSPGGGGASKEENGTWSKLTHLACC